MDELKAKVDELEKRILETKIEELEKKLFLMKQGAVSVTNSDKEAKSGLFNIFYNEILCIKKGKKINTADVVRKANEFAFNYNVRFTKFEVSNFMKEKGLKRSKISGTNFYLDICAK